MALIRAISFDFDGALFNRDFHLLREIITANQFLLDLILKNEEGYARTTLYAGTNRQSVSDDSMNAAHNDTGSAYPYLIQLKRYLKTRLKSVKLDKFLLTDLYNQLEAGETFNEALLLLEKNHSYNREKLRKGPFKDWLHDKSKLTVLYAQIHRFARKNSKDKIDFYFYDDREDILGDLHSYFHQNPEKLPSNLCLKLRRYRGGKDLVDYQPIQGTGKIDNHYKTTVKQMAAATIQSTRFQQKSPANLKGKPVQTYEEAESSHFVLTATLDCINDSQLLKTSSAAVPPPAPQQESSSSEKEAQWHSFIMPTALPHHSLFRQAVQRPSESSNTPREANNPSPTAIAPPSQPMSTEKELELIAWQFYKPSDSATSATIVREQTTGSTTKPSSHQEDKQISSSHN